MVTTTLYWKGYVASPYEGKRGQPSPPFKEKVMPPSPSKGKGDATTTLSGKEEWSPPLSEGSKDGHHILLRGMEGGHHHPLREGGMVTTTL